MNKGEYRDLFRRTMRDDIVGPQLFNDDEIDFLVQEAREEACLRSRLCRLSPAGIVSAPAIITLLDSTYDYPLDPSIFRVTRVTLIGSDPPNKPIHPETEQEFSFYGFDEQLNRSGTPRSYFIDEDKILHLDKSFTTAGECLLYLEGFKLPVPLVLDDDEDLEILQLGDQQKLLFYAYSRAYMMQDSEVEHVTKSQFFEAQFDKKFGAPKTADQIRKQFQYRDRTTKYGGIPGGSTTRYGGYR